MEGNSLIQWDLPDPFTLEIVVVDEDTDELGHANNVVYVRWLEDISWAHVKTLGMDWALHEATGKAMAITRTEIDYLASANPGDRLIMGTWLTDFDGRFRTARQFQLVRASDSKTLMRAVSTHACVDLATQRPARVPREFAEIMNAVLVSGAGESGV